MKVCVNCDHENTNDTVRCERCGRLVDQKTDVSDNKHNYRCKNCNEIISIRYGAKDRCPYCHELPRNPKTGGMTGAIAMFLRTRRL